MLNVIDSRVNDKIQSLSLDHLIILSKRLVYTNIQDVCKLNHKNKWNINIHYKIFTNKSKHRYIKCIFYSKLPLRSFVYNRNVFLKIFSNIDKKTEMYNLDIVMKYFLKILKCCKSSGSFGINFYMTKYYFVLQQFINRFIGTYNIRLDISIFQCCHAWY